MVRLVDDGAGHDLTDIDTFEDLKPVSLLSVGDDGSVWLTSSGGFIKIGTPGEISDPLDTFLAQMEIGPDGTLWIADGHHGASIGSFHSGSWTIHELPSTAWVVWLDATPEGGLRFAWRDGTTLLFGELSEGDGDPTIAPPPPPLELGSPDGHIAVAHTPDGLVWVAESLWWQEEQRREPGRLWVSDGKSWRLAEPLGADTRTQPEEMVVDAEGRLWIMWHQVVPGRPVLGASGYLTRRDDERSWTVFSDPTEGATGGWLLADGDSVWLGPGWCEGYARFDGGQLDRYLEGLCVRRPGISPSGDIWLFGHRRNRKRAGVYFISPSQRRQTLSRRPGWPRRWEARLVRQLVTGYVFQRAQVTTGVLDDHGVLEDDVSDPPPGFVETHSRQGEDGPHQRSRPRPSVTVPRPATLRSAATPRTPPCSRGPAGPSTPWPGTRGRSSRASRSQAESP